MYVSYNTQKALHDDRVRELTENAEPQFASQIHHSGLIWAIIRVVGSLRGNQTRRQPARPWQPVNGSPDCHAITRQNAR